MEEMNQNNQSPMPNQPQQAPQAPNMRPDEPKSSVGAAIGIIIIIILIVLGGLYFWGGRLDTLEDDAMMLEETSDSDEIADIETDLDAVNSDDLDTLDAELEDIDAELDAGATAQ